MNSNPRLHSVLLTLWDIARDNPGYDRRLWGELQRLLSQLENRNNLLCAVVADLLQATDNTGSVVWENSSTFSPPEGYAVKFLREELRRGERPTLPPPPTALPHWELESNGGSNQVPLGVSDGYDEFDESDDELAFEIEFDSSDDLI